MKKSMSALLFVLGTSAANASLISEGFEGANVNGLHTIVSSLTNWQTNDAFEIWTSGFLNVASNEGNQFLELNAYIASSMYQDISGVTAGESLDFSFAHRGRSGNESLNFSMVDAGVDNVFGTADDFSLFSKTYTSGTGAWSIYDNSAIASIVSKGNDIRVRFTATTGTSVGNFLDSINVRVSVPEPTPLAIMAFGLIGLMVSRKKA